jgi:hypothetical protein
VNLLENLSDKGLDYEKCKDAILDMMNQTREDIILRTVQVENCSRKEVPNFLLLNSDYENLYDKYLGLSFALDYRQNNQVDAETEEVVRLYLENVNYNKENSKLKEYLRDYLSNPKKIDPDFNGRYSSEEDAISLKRLQSGMAPYGNHPKAWPILPLISHLQNLSLREENFNALIRHEYTHRVLNREVSSLTELKREKPYVKAIDESAAQAVSIIMVGKVLDSDYYRERNHTNRALLETCTQAFVHYAEGEENPVDKIRRRAVEVIGKIQSGETGQPEELILNKSMSQDFGREKKLRAEIERIEYYFQDSIQILNFSGRDKNLWEGRRGKMGEDVIEMAEFLQEKNTELAELIAEKYSEHHRYFKIVANLESRLEDLEAFLKREDEEIEEIKRLVRELETAKSRLNEDIKSENVEENLHNYRTILEKSRKIAGKLESKAKQILEEMEQIEEEIQQLTKTELFQGRGFHKMEEDIEYTIYRMLGMADGAKKDIERFIEDYERIPELVERSEKMIEKVE